MNDSIINKIMEEHRQVEGLMEQIIAATEPIQKAGLYLDLRQILLPHLDGEEQSLYRHLQDDVHVREAEEIASRAMDEHREIRDALHRLDSEEIETTDWDACFRELMAQVLNHFQVEEDELIPEARNDFSRDELTRIASEFDEAKHVYGP